MKYREITILAADDKFLPLAANELSFSKTVCGVAATDGALLFRAYEELVCIKDVPNVASMKKP